MMMVRMWEVMMSEGVQVVRSYEQGCVLVRVAMDRRKSKGMMLNSKTDAG